MAFNLPLYKINVDFTASTQSIVEGATVSFTNLTTGSPTQYYWNFGNGQSSTFSSPSVSYNTAGTYSVSLMAANENAGGYKLKTNFVVVSQAVVSYLLDDYTNSSAAYSVRKLKSTATASMRIRRVSDNTELDIGFVGADLDTAAIETFAESENCYVKTWYDQSGSGRHVTQTTLAEQPLIFNAPSMQTGNNGKPALNFNDALCLIGPTDLNINNIRSSFAVTNVNAESVPGRYAAAPFSSRYNDANIGYAMFNYAVSANVAGGWIKNVNAFFDIYFTDDEQNIIVQHLNTSNGNWYLRLKTPSTDVNDTVDYSSALPFSGTNSNNITFKVGVDRAEDGSDPYYWAGLIQEIIIFSDDKTSAETAIVSSQVNYFTN